MQSKLTGSIYLFIIAFIFYGNSISNKYALDDAIVLTQNSYTQKGVAGLKDIFTHDSFQGMNQEASQLSGGRYRPLSLASFAIEKDLYGNKPAVYHFFNVLFFALTVVMLFLLLTKLIKVDKINNDKINYVFPFLAALLFAILPVHTEVVANIKSRDEIYSLLFSLTAFFLLLPKSVNQKKNEGKNKNQVDEKVHFKISRIIAATVFFFLALLSKENAIVFIVLIPLGLKLFSDDSNSRIILKSAPLAIITLIYLVIRNNMAGMVGDRETSNIMNDPYIHATLSQKLATISFIQFKYLLLQFFPYQLSNDYSYNEIPLVNWSNIQSLMSVIVHLALIAIAIIKFRIRIISFSIIFYFITFALVSNIFFNVGTSMAERFTYMPSVGLCILLGWCFIKIFKIENVGKPAIKTIPVLIILAVVVLASIKAIARNKEWKDNYTLYKADYVKVPNSARARLFYGIETMVRYKETQEPSLLNEGIAQMQKAVEINPEYSNAWLNLGLAYEVANKIPESIKCYDEVLRIEPSKESALYSLGYAYAKKMNQPDNAIPYFERLISSDKTNKPEYYEGLGVCYDIKGDYAASIRYYKEGIARYPSAAKLYYNTGMSYGRLGKLDSSDMYFNKAFELEPGLKEE